jgi:transposase-like protein
MSKQYRLGEARAADFRTRTTPACGGRYCPRCSSSELRYGELQTDGVQSWCSVECDDCYSLWEARYTLSPTKDADAIEPGITLTQNAA